MKRILTVVAASLFAIAAAGPAFAQGQYDADFNNFLSKHPNEARQLQANPRLIDNPTYIQNHPGLQKYLDNHPNVRRSIREQSRGEMGGPGGPGGFAGRGPGEGDYDANHQWHNEQWWQQNNPQQWRQNHPDWAQNHPHWGNDGDYDEHHQWQNAQWWQQHHPKKWHQWHGNGHPGNGHPGNGHPGNGPDQH